jgi:hypothetical protein
VARCGRSLKGSAYSTFINRGKGGAATNRYKMIRCHMIYDVKHDGCHKAHLVAGSHLTDPNTESVYSGVVSLCGIGLVAFLAELNQLELWGADVGNAYLEALTKENKCTSLLDRNLEILKDIRF